MQLGNKYELGRTLGEGNFGKVRFARDVVTGRPFAVKILEKNRILDLKITDQIKREIQALKLLKHPNVVRLHEVLASKTKIYMILEYVNGGELFERIQSKGKLSEVEGRKLFQRLIDGSDGLLHTTCGSPNYVSPEIISNRGYDGATSDIWACGVILYVVLTGYLPFDDRNLAALYQKILKGDPKLPSWLSSGARSLLKRIFDPDPRTGITMVEIKDDEWFKQDYIPVIDDEEEDSCMGDESLPFEDQRDSGSPSLINAFQLIGMSSWFDLSGFFEKEDVSERKIRFTSNHSRKELLDKIEETVSEMGFQVQKKNRSLKAIQENKGQKCPGSLFVAAEVWDTNDLVTMQLVDPRLLITWKGMYMPNVDS